MTTLRVALAGLIAVLVAATPATAAAPGLAPLADRFPERSFILTLAKPAELTAESVTLRENGAPVGDLALSAATASGGRGAAVVLVLDASDSMRGRAIEAAVGAACAFVAQKTPNLAIGVITFNSSHSVRLPPTNDSTAIRNALAATPSLAHGTRFYDALAASIKLLDASEARAKSVVLLSDGADVGSALSSDVVVAQAKASNVRLFTVGIRSNDFEPTALRELAVQTRGAYAESGASGISSIFRNLGRALSSEYLIEYTSRVGPDTAVDVVARIAGVEGLATASYTSPALPASSSRGFEPSTVDRILQSAWLLFAVIIACAALAAFAATRALPTRPDGSVVGRISQFVAPPRPENHDRATSVLSTKILSGTERSLRRLQRWSQIKEALDVAQIRIPAEQIAVFTLIGTVFAGWLVNFLVGPLPALVAALSVPVCVYGVARRKLVALQRSFAEQLPDNLEVLASALRAGHSLAGALSVVVGDAAEPSRREFKRVVTNEQLGIPLEEALGETVRRMANRDLEQVGLIASVQRRAGGDVAEVLDRITETVRGRQEVRRLVRTLTAQGRLARWIVTILPVALFLLVSFLNPDYASELYSRPAGIVLLAVAGSLVVIGSLIIKKIVDIKV
jgi:tight adherence protein B